MEFSRFKGHYILGDRGATEDVDKLVAIMAKRVGRDVFKRPNPPYVFKDDASAEESYTWLQRYLLPSVPNNSVLFGFGIGGLIASRLQEDFPAKRLSVVAINSPVSEGSVKLVATTKTPASRVAIYSNLYPPIQGQIWPLLASQAYDLLWLQHGIKDAKHGLAYLLTAYMEIENISIEVKAFSESSEPKSAGANAQ